MSDERATVNLDEESEEWEGEYWGESEEDDYIQFGTPFSGGTPFLVNELADPNALLIVEAAFGVDIKSVEPQMWNWYDITSDVRKADGARLTISPMGRNDESSQSPPAGCGFQLDNTSGNYTRFHPGSKWWPNIQRNTPIRVRLFIYGSFTLIFQGQVNGWVPSWDTTCNLAVVSVTASGKTRQLNQGKTPLKSAITRSIPHRPASPVAWWPMEDGSTATSASSGLASGSPMKTTSVTFGVASGLAGAPTLAQLSTASSFYGPVSHTFSNNWQVDWYMKIPLAAAVDETNPTLRIRVTGASIDRVDFLVGKNPGSGFQVLVVRTYLNNVLVTDSGEFVPPTPWGDWFHFYLTTENWNTPGSTNLWYLQAHAGDPSAAGNIMGTYSGSAVGSITSVEVPNGANLAGVIVGQITVTDTFDQLSDTTQTGSAWYISSAYAGENCTARLTRLCAEEGVAIDVTGTSTVTMGPQGVTTLMALLRECEVSDDGLLFDGLGPGLGYITRESRYNPPVALSLDVAQDHLDDPFQPTDDDQRNRNIVKVDQKNGSSAIYEDDTSLEGTTQVGDYDSSQSVNLNAPEVSALTNRGAHEVKKGTFLGFRYPKLKIDLAAMPGLVRGWLATPLVGRIDVLNVSSKATQHPPGTVSQILEGYSMSLSPDDWDVEANCSPLDPWKVPVLESPDTSKGWRLESGDSSLFQTYAVGTTSIQVEVGDGALWSTAPADYPRDLDIGGVQVTATAVGKPTDAFSRTSASGWGNADTGETWSLVWSGGANNATDFTVGSGVGSMSQPTVNGYRYAYLGALAFADADVSVTFTAPLASGGPLEPGNILMRGTTINSYVMARVRVETTNAVTALFFDSAGNQLGSVTIPGLTHAGTGTPLRVRARAIGSQLSMTVWKASDAEPDLWHLVATDPTPVSGWVAVRAGVSGTNTNSLPVVFTFDDFQAVGSPQIFTVNPLPYALAEDSAVHIWQSPKLAL